MSDAASGAEVLTGQGDTPPVANQPTGNAPPWYGNQELTGYIENKGWKDPSQVVEGYKNLEKILGDKANALVLPKEGDATAWGDFYNRLGRPANSGEYKFSDVEGGDENLTNWFKETAHKNGLTQAQAAAMYDEWNQHMQSGSQESQVAAEAKATKDINDLKKEWGNEYEANIKAGQRAASRFGFTEAEIVGMEQSVGTKAMLQRFAQIGRALGEDSFESGSGGRDQFGLTPQAAQQQIKDLQMDSNFNAAYLDAGNPGHKAAAEKMRNLFEAAYPGGAL